MSQASEAFLSQQKTIDESVRRQFEQAWHARKPRPIEEFLPLIDPADLLPTLEELVLIDVEMSWKAWHEITPSQGNSAAGTGPPLLVERYLARFPVLCSDSIVRRLIKQEYTTRCRHGDQPRLQDCPDCRH
jgi:hypothetical protein